MLGAAAPAADRVPPLAAAPATFAGIFLFIGLGEEPAWRGYALPRLQRVATPIGGVLLLWLLHALWHLPLFGSEYDWSNGPPWLLGLLGYTIATTWLYRRTDGNLLLPALLHASLNTAAHYVFAPLQQGPDLLRLWWLWGGLWCAAGIVSGMSLARLDSGTARRGVSFGRLTLLSFGARRFGRWASWGPPASRCSAARTCRRVRRASLCRPARTAKKAPATTSSPGTKP